MIELGDIRGGGLLLDSYRKLCADIKELEAQRDKLRERLISVIGSAAGAKYHGQPVISYKPNRPSFRFDKDAFIADHGEGAYEKYATKAVASRPFRLLEDI